MLSLCSKAIVFCEYMLEISLLAEIKHLKFSECEIALGILMISCHFYANDDIDKLSIYDYGYNKNRINKYSKQLFKVLMEASEVDVLRPIYDRYSREKYYFVACIRFVKKV